MCPDFEETKERTGLERPFWALNRQKLSIASSTSNTEFLSDREKAQRLRSGPFLGLFEIGAQKRSNPVYTSKKRMRQSASNIVDGRIPWAPAQRRKTAVTPGKLRKPKAILALW